MRTKLPPLQSVLCYILQTIVYGQLRLELQPLPQIFAPSEGEITGIFRCAPAKNETEPNSLPQLKLQIRAQAIGRDKCIFVT